MTTRRTTTRLALLPLLLVTVSGSPESTAEQDQELFSLLQRNTKDKAEDLIDLRAFGTQLTKGGRAEKETAPELRSFQADEYSRAQNDTDPGILLEGKASEVLADARSGLAVDGLRKLFAFGLHQGKSHVTNFLQILNKRQADEGVLTTLVGFVILVMLFMFVVAYGCFVGFAPYGHKAASSPFATVSPSSRAATSNNALVATGLASNISLISRPTLASKPYMDVPSAPMRSQTRSGSRPAVASARAMGPPVPNPSPTMCSLQPCSQRESLAYGEPLYPMSASTLMKGRAILHTLCPDLVVEEEELLVAVPSVLRAQRLPCELRLVDKAGNVVNAVRVENAGVPRAASVLQPTLILLDWPVRNPIAECTIAGDTAQFFALPERRLVARLEREALSPGPPSGLPSGCPSICAGEVPIYAMTSRDMVPVFAMTPRPSDGLSATYLVTNEADGQVLLRLQSREPGNPEGGLIAASPDRISAVVAEPGFESGGNRYSWMRVSPGVDAGLAALSVMVVDCLLNVRQR